MCCRTGEITEKFTMLNCTAIVYIRVKPYFRCRMTNEEAFSSKSVGNFFDNPVNADFGLRTSDSWIRTVIRIVTKIELIGPWAMPYPSKKFCQNPFTTFQLSDGQRDRQTDRQTDRSENITSFGGGNECCAFRQADVWKESNNVLVAGNDEYYTDCIWVMSVNLASTAATVGLCAGSSSQHCCIRSASLESTGSTLDPAGTRGRNGGVSPLRTRPTTSVSYRPRPHYPLTRDLIIHQF